MKERAMTSDEREIHALVATWMAATRAGDLDTVLGLMTDDVVFLVHGREPMIGKDAYAAAAREMAETGAPAIDGRSDIREIVVHGDMAFMWTHLQVVMTPSGGAAMRRAGYTLTVLRKERGHWVIARDANLLAPA
jgi:uncharacterized protein (TIGR02246 family)